MKLSKVKIGDFVELFSERCNIPNLSEDDVSGINRDKEFFEPSKQVGNDTSKYKIVPPNYFACNLMHVGRDVVLPISMNHTTKNKIVSPAYTVFRIKDEKLILREYFFISLKSDEKDRFFWFNTDSSVRDGMEWEVFCNVEIEIPSIEIQRKYVAIYKAMQHNLKVYESKLEDLKLVCDGYIENCEKKKKIGKLIDEYSIKNDDSKIVVEKGVSIEKKFIDTKASASDISKQKIVNVNTFAFNSNTSRNGDSISIALNDDEPYIVSNTYITIKCDESIILPKYLFLWMKRKEFDRFARFNSWGSARETISVDELREYEITIPNIEIQKDIIKVFDIYTKRKQYVDLLRKEISNICPILIAGAIKEAKEYV